jgi:predicted DNA-binding transcriptional regulator AlpA
MAQSSSEGSSSPSKPPEYKGILDKPAIHIHEFISLAAHALVPLRTKVEGIQCVATVVVPMPKQGAEKTTWLPLRLTAELARKLQAVLDVLPRLHFPMSPDEETNFIVQYLLLPHREKWIPLLLQQSDLERDMEIRIATSLRLLRELPSDPDFQPFDTNHNPTRANASEAYLDSGLAERILRKRGLLQKAIEVLTAHRGEVPPLRPFVGTPTEVRYPGFPLELLFGGTVSDLQLEVWHRTLATKRPSAHGSLATQQPRPQFDSISAASDPGLGDDDPCYGQQLTDEKRHIDVRTASLPPAAIGRKIKKTPERLDSENRAALAVLPATDRLPALLTAEQVARLIGVKSDQTVRNRVNPGAGKSYDPEFPRPKVVAGNFRWVTAEIQSYIASRPSRS